MSHTETSTKASDNSWVHGLIGVSLSELHTNVVNGAFSLIILSYDCRHTIFRYALYSKNVQITFTTDASESVVPFLELEYVLLHSKSIGCSTVS